MACHVLRVGNDGPGAPGLVAEMAAAGHEVAVHGDEHTNMLRRLPGRAAADIRRCRDTVADLAGVEPTWFRPPFGLLSFGALRGATCRAHDGLVDDLGS